jgi:hypothetical protein
MLSKKEKPFEEFESFEQFFEQAESRPGYWGERAKLEFTREVLDRMKQIDVSKGELASRLEVQPGMVTRFLSGHNNFELDTMVRVALALNCRFKSHLQPIGAKTLWFDILESEPERRVEGWAVNQFEPVLSTVEQVNHDPIPAAA